MSIDIDRVDAGEYPDESDFVAPDPRSEEIQAELARMAQEKAEAAMSAEERARYEDALWGDNWPVIDTAVRDLAKAQQLATEIAAKARSGDDEAAHSLEDRLREDVLRVIAAGAKNAQELAAAALATNDIGFERWCA